MKGGQTTRTCRKCGETKPLAEFPVYDREGRRRHACRVCNDTRVDAHHQANRDRRLAQARARYAADPTAVWTPERRRRANDLAKVRGAQLRETVIAHYGGRCVCCGETHIEFLTLDHVNGDGAKMRREVHGSTAPRFYLWVIRNGYPETIQVLCMNCNWGRARNGGVCPHKEGSTTIPKGSRAKRLEVPRIRPHKRGW